jgi:thymidylate kinase
MKATAIIYFMGMDGSGKSTLSSYLYNELKTRSYDVERVWWLEYENSALRRLLRRLSRTRMLRFDRHLNRAESTVRSKHSRLTVRLFSVLYPRLVLFDYLIFGIKKVWIPKMTGKEKILIFDRYIYDVIFSLSQEFDFPLAKRISLFGRYGKLLPIPDRVLFIEVSPEIAFLRKKEEFGSIEDAKALWQTHQALFLAVEGVARGRSRIIDNTGDIEVVKREVLKEALNVVH